jgi:hypothetical protein
MNGQFATNEAHIPLAQVPSLRGMPRRKNGKKLHRSTIFRWAGGGLGDPKIRLRTVQVGGQKCTTLAFLAEFFEALSKDPGHPFQQHVRKIRSATQKVHEILTREGF